MQQLIDRCPILIFVRREKRMAKESISHARSLSSKYILYQTRTFSGGMANLGLHSTGGC